MLMLDVVFYGGVAVGADTHRFRQEPSGDFILAGCHLAGEGSQRISKDVITATWLSALWRLEKQ